METYGCAANQADSAIMSNLLEGAGYRPTADPAQSDVVIVNTCGVKSPTENRIMDRLARLSNAGKPIVVAGCLTKINWKRLMDIANFGTALTPYSVERIVEAVDIAMRDPRGRRLIESSSPPDKPALARSDGGLIGTLEIEDGCTFSCSFCATKFSRGPAHSYSPGAIARAARRLILGGAKELRLTGQDVASYRADGYDLTDLVRLVLSNVSGDYRIRIGMMTPVLARRIRDGLLPIYKLDNVYKFMHIPVQSGSDDVLRLMRRGHDVGLFRDLVNSSRASIPMLTVETDIIVGHPGEDEDDFERTLRLMELTEPDVVNLSKYSNRPGTEASRMRQLPSQVIARRSADAYHAAMRIMEERNSKWMGWSGRALILEIGSRPGTMIGRNDWYKPIVVEGGADLLGRWVDVTVDGYTPVHLNGKVSRST